MTPHPHLTHIPHAPRAAQPSSVKQTRQVLLDDGFQRLPIIVVAALLLASCASRPPPPTAPAAVQPPVVAAPAGTISPTAPRPIAITTPPGQGKSRWIPVAWSDLPGFEADSLHEAWNAWLKNCERPNTVFAPLCADVRRLSIATGEEQRAWMTARLQPFRIESQLGAADGQLTSYYEPVFKASRKPGNGFEVPLYRAPATLASRRPWYTRQEIDTLPEARQALKGREIAWIADPIDMMMLHIQGSGRLSFDDLSAPERPIRVAFAGTNEQPYRSINQWLLEQGVTNINPWPDATKAWALQNPQRVPQLLWSNPRFVFFKEEALTDFDAAFGPRGAQGVPLTPGRSIAVDPASIPYGTPVWLASRGPAVQLQKLVFAQDTGSAIVGAVRADYFAGTGFEAGVLAAKVNQPLRLWALWPK